jgi:hypothetical protein
MSSIAKRQSAVSWSKHCATPELPLLEGAADQLLALGECDLLPAAVVDTLGKLEAPTPTTGAPQSPDDFEEDANHSEEDVSEEEENNINIRGRDYIMSPDRRIFMRNGFIDGELHHEQVLRPRCGSSPACLGKLEEVDEHPVGFHMESEATAADQAEDPEEVPASGMRTAWWCRFVQDSAGVQITPLLNGRVAEAAIEDELSQECENGMMMLWCWLQPEVPAGRLRVVPCTTMDYCHPGDLSMSSADYLCEQFAPSGAKPELAPECCALSVVSDEDFAPPEPPAGSHVPAWANGAAFASDRKPTTLLLSNLPARLEQDDLVEMLDRLEFSGFYDFVFLLPKEGGRRSAVVNLTRHTWALRLAAWIHGKSAWGEGVSDGASCEAAWSTADQGVDALVLRYRDAATDEEVPEEERPLLLASRGWQV